MGMFNTREPRKFRRVSIYTDERKDKLDKLVKEYKQEQEHVPMTVENIEPDHFKGKFRQFAPKAQKHAENGHSVLTWPVMLIAVIILILVWHYLLTGNVHI